MRRVANFGLLKLAGFLLMFIILWVGFVPLKSAAQVKISDGVPGGYPDVSAILELQSSNKGFLAPRVALKSPTDVVTIQSPASGLLVYNLGTAGLGFVGYVFWNGFEWRSFNNSNLSPGSVGTITCNGVTASPSTYQAGVEYNGTMIIPYTDANGGVYAGQTLGPVNGLTATLTSGNFNVGSGQLAFTVSGTPIQGSPTTTTFSINIGGKTCSAVIGSGSGIAPGDLVFFQGSFLASKSSGMMSDEVPNLPILGGKLRVDGTISASANGGNGRVSFNPVLVNITDKPVKLWYSAITTIDRFNAGNYVVAAKSYVQLDNGIYSGYGFNEIAGATGGNVAGRGSDANQEVVTADVSIDDKWYRVYYFPTVDNMNTTTDTDNLRKIYVSIQRLY